MVCFGLVEFVRCPVRVVSAPWSMNDRGEASRWKRAARISPHHVRFSLQKPDRCDGFPEPFRHKRNIIRLLTESVNHASKDL